MKNPIHSKSMLTLSIGVLTIILLVSSCSENKAVDSKDEVNQGNLSNLEVDDNTILVVENDKDSKFMMNATEIQMELISLGKLAQRKGTSDHVKELGKMMEDDHTKILVEIQAMAHSKSDSISTSDSKDSRDAYEELDNKTGNEFGKAYSKMVVDHHKDAIKLFEDAASDSNDEEIRNWASSQLSGLKTNLQHAEACKAKCDKM